MKDSSISRKKFISWGVIITSISAFPLPFLFKKQQFQQSSVSRMLTQDGRLVEIDMSKVKGNKQKIKDADIHTWIKGKQNL